MLATEKQTKTEENGFFRQRMCSYKQRIKITQFFPSQKNVDIQAEQMELSWSSLLLLALNRHVMFDHD